MSTSVETHSPEETQAIGRCLARVLRPGDVIGLEGDLGAGKTVLVQGLAAGLGVTVRVHSPTFVLHHRYPGPVPLEHYDLYRLGALDWHDAGLDEPAPGSITVIEWAERGAPLRDWTTVRIHLQSVNEQVRRLTCLKGGERVEECFRANADPGH
jgi:tRNA threonylcarbamoyladenosine biosynthesis protein TsaE